MAEIKNENRKKIFIVRDKQPDQEYFDAFAKVGVICEWGESPQNVDEFDGLLVPGGVDVNPKLYGEENTASVEINDHLDQITIDCIKLFFEKGKPILGICRGLQILNVYFGGTLIQDIPNHKDVDHEILIDDGNVVHDHYGGSMVINSLHHQCIGELAKDLTCLAKSHDGIIEIFMHKNGKILGTQFHPEKMQNGEKIFEIFKNLL